MGHLAHCVYGALLANFQADGLNPFSVLIFKRVLFKVGGIRDEWR